MSEARVIGIGSPFGADRAGWLAAEWLAGCGAEGLAGVDFLTLDRPGAELLTHLTGFRRVVIIDALLAGEGNGAVRTLAPEQLRRDSDGLSNHGFGVADALALGEALGDLPERVTVLGIEVRANGEPLFDREGLLRRVSEQVRES